jgi:hypothetical protein
MMAEAVTRIEPESPVRIGQEVVLGEAAGRAPNCYHLLGRNLFSVPRAHCLARGHGAAAVLGSFSRYRAAPHA